MSMKDREASAQATITRIADLLDCPVAALTGGAQAPLDVKGASELLTIWAEMDDDRDRERLLAFARALTKV